MTQNANKAGEVLAARKNELTVVAQDQNWRSYVANELKCADMWDQDWGFLGGASQGKFLSLQISLLIMNLKSHFRETFGLKISQMKS